MFARRCIASGPHHVIPLGTLFIGPRKIGQETALEPHDSDGIAQVAQSHVHFNNGGDEGLCQLLCGQKYEEVMQSWQFHLVSGAQKH